MDGEAAVPVDPASSASPPARRARPEPGRKMAAAQFLQQALPEFYQEERQEQEYVERRAADARLREMLAALDFSGPRYQWFENELARYGLAVLKGWMRTGRIFALTAELGYPLYPGAAELKELERDGSVRQELADVTVALTLPAFRRRALVDGGWRADGGAALATYFTGACLRVFVNEYRKRRRYENRWRSHTSTDITMLDESTPAADDVEIVAIGNIRIEEHLSQLPERTRDVLLLVLAGYTQQEIVEMLGMTSTRAVESILRRWRSAAQRHLAKGAS